jgi:hypothetical protein
MNPQIDGFKLFAAIEDFNRFATSFNVILALVILAFWAWMLMDAVTKESPRYNDRAVWVLVILFGNFFGALIYLLYRRPQRKRLAALAYVE